MSTALNREIENLEADLKLARQQRGAPLPGLEDKALDEWIGRLETQLQEAREEAELEALGRAIFAQAVAEEDEE